MALRPALPPAVVLVVVLVVSCAPPPGGGVTRPTVEPDGGVSTRGFPVGVDRGTGGPRVDVRVG